MKLTSDCIACAIVSKEVKVEPLYEDEGVVAVLDTKGANLGQMIVFPKRHVPIIEQLSPREWQKLGVVGNALSVALFEVMSPKGTNIFVANGISAGQTIAHVMIHIIPRAEKDEVVLTPQGKTFSDQQLSSIELKIKDMLEEKKEEVIETPAIRPLPTDAVSIIQKQLYRMP